MCAETDDVNLCLQIDTKKDVTVYAERLTQSEKETVRELSQTVCVENERETDKETYLSEEDLITVPAVNQ